MSHDARLHTHTRIAMTDRPAGRVAVVDTALTRAGRICYVKIQNNFVSLMNQEKYGGSKVHNKSVWPRDTI